MTDFGTAVPEVTQPDLGWWQDVNNLTYRTFPAFAAGLNAGNLPFSSTGGYAGGTVGKSLQSRGIVVTDPPYNADPTGVNDSWQAITAAITALGTASGGTVILPPGNYIVKQQLTNIYNNVTLKGAGGMIDGNIVFEENLGNGPADWQAALLTVPTRITWAGPSGGTLWAHACPESTALSQPQSLVGGGCEDILFDGAASAYFAGVIKSVRAARYRNVSFVRATKSAGLITCTQTIPSGATVYNFNNSCSNNTFDNVTWSNLYAFSTPGDAGLVLAGCGLYGNTCQSAFLNCQILNSNGGNVGNIYAFNLENCDDNDFFNVKWNGLLALHATDTMSFSIASANVGFSPCLYNNFYHSMGNIIAKKTVGAVINPSGIQITAPFNVTNQPSLGNQIHCYSLNSFNHPIVEAGADLTVFGMSVGTTGAGITGGGFVGTQVINSGTQSIPNSTPTTLTWTTNYNDFLSCWSASAPTQITVPSIVKWAQIHAQIEFATQFSTGELLVQLQINGTTVAQDLRNNIAGYAPLLTMSSRWIQVTPGQAITVVITQSSGTTQTLAASSQFEVDYK